MEQEKRTIKVALRENKTATADKAPYLMTVIPNGTAGIADIVAEMRKDGFNITEAMFRLYLNALFEVAIEHVRKGEKVQTPFGLMELAISGSMDCEDAKLDPTRNEVYVKITPPASWRKALAEVEGVIVNPATSDLSIGNVLTVSLGRDGFNVLRPGDAFSMSGRGFPTDGTEDGAVTLRDGEGMVHVVEVESARRECLNCRAPRTAAVGEGLLEVTLVGGKKGDCRFSASRKVKIVAPRDAEKC